MRFISTTPKISKLSANMPLINRTISIKSAGEIPIDTSLPLIMAKLIRCVYNENMEEFDEYFEEITDLYPAYDMDKLRPLLEEVWKKSIVVLALKIAHTDQNFIVLDRKSLGLPIVPAP